MANTIKPKRSYTLSSVPSGLSSGELAVNASATPKVWIGNSAGTGNVLIASLSLSDMVGNTDNITQGSTNKYYADSLARASISSSATGLTYTSGTGVFSFTAGYSIPTTASQTNWDSAYTQRLQWDGGSTNLVAATGRTSLGATTVGGNLFTLTNPSAITFPRLNADNTVSALDAATFRTAIGAGTSSTTGTVTSIATTSPITGGTITGSGTIGINASSANTASYVVQRDASGNFSAGTITANLTGTASTATNLAGGSGGTIPYQSAANTTAFLSNGTANQILQANGGTSAPTWVSTLTGVTITGTKEAKVAVSASAIDLATGNYFTKTISGTTTFTVSNIPASGTGISFILDLTNGGSATINWWSGMKWAGGSAPTLTSAGRDALGFFTHDGGTTWSGLVLGKDIK